MSSSTPLRSDAKGFEGRDHYDNALRTCARGILSLLNPTKVEEDDKTPIDWSNLDSLVVVCKAKGLPKTDQLGAGAGDPYFEFYVNGEDEPFYKSAVVDNAVNVQWKRFVLNKSYLETVLASSVQNTTQNAHAFSELFPERT